VIRMICLEPGCTSLVRRGYCAEHAPKHRRRSVHRRGYTRTWRARRLAWLSAQPWCARCEASGRLVRAVDVHHTVRHRGDVAGVLGGGLESLCKACHGRATAAGE